MNNLIAAINSEDPDSWGTLVVFAIGGLAYAGWAVYEWLKDVRYYRARQIVRDRERNS